jgi:hypothetical protein
VIVGTPHYMSPEQATADRDLDGRSDVYALGIIGYRMLSGRLPFDGVSVQEVLTQHVTREAPPLAAPDEDSVTLASAVMRCLQKDPKDRWPTAAAFSQACRPRDDLEADLPDEIAQVPSLATKAMFGAYATGMGIALLNAYSADRESLIMLAATPFVPFAVAAAAATQARRHGVPWTRAFKMAFWMPATWWGWWPKALRRPGDVWSRLPRNIRLVRTLLTSAFTGILAVFVPAMTIMVTWVIGENPLPWSRDLARAVIGTAFPLFMAGLLAVPIGMSVRWPKRFGLSNRLSQRLIWEPTWNNAKFWQRPEIAKLLEGARAARAALSPQTPNDYVAAISQALATLPDAVQLELAEAGETAHELARVVAAVDAELSELARHADPAERARLEQKLSAMPTATLDESASRRQVRDLISGQIALIDQLEARRRALADERERFVALLKSVWLQVASLRAESASASLSATEITGRVRALRDEIARQRLARTEVERLAPGVTTPV